MAKDEYESPEALSTNDLKTAVMKDKDIAEKAISPVNKLTIKEQIITGMNEAQMNVTIKDAAIFISTIKGPSLISTLSVKRQVTSVQPRQTAKTDTIFDNLISKR